MFFKNRLFAYVDWFKRSGVSCEICGCLLTLTDACYVPPMNNPFRYTLLVVTLIIPTIVSAQTRRVHPIDKALEACIEKDPSTAGMVGCTDIAYKKWDQELNKNYQNLMSKLKPAGKQLLKQSQLTWIAFRDHEFKLIDSLYDDLQGTMYIPMRYDERMEIVKLRALALAAHLDTWNESEP